MDYFLIYLLLGSVAGFLAGLIGIGGGLVIVPTLSFVFLKQGHDLSTAMHYAIGSSLACIVFTALSSVYHHKKSNNIDGSLFKKLLPGLLLGALIGVYAGQFISGQMLQFAFGLFSIIVSCQMLFQKNAENKKELPNKKIIMLIGLLVGIVSSILGLGGGVLLVPFFSYCHVNMRVAIGTASVSSFVVSLCSMIGSFVFLTTQNREVFPFSTGYIYWPAVLCVLITSVFCASLGVKLTTYLPATIIKRIFALFLILVAAHIMKIY